MSAAKEAYRPVSHRFRSPNRRELVAMWIWSTEYAKGGLGAVGAR